MENVPESKHSIHDFEVGFDSAQRDTANDFVNPLTLTLSRLERETTNDLRINE